MIVPATLNLVAPRRVPFLYEIKCEGQDYSGSTAEMHVRLTRETPGTPLIDLNAEVYPNQGIYIAVDYVSEPVMFSTITIHISKATLAALPNPGVNGQGEVGDDAVFFYDLHLTPPGGVEFILIEGTFTVRGGATQ